MGIAKRDYTIDLLRTIGIIAIIMNHSSFNDDINRFISFDVVLLMFLSGMSYALSTSKVSYFNYVQKRFKKLILPCWIFLLFFFLISTLLFKNPFSINVMIKSFMLVAGGILFVWIYRVYFTTALLNPLIKKLYEKSELIFILSIIGLFLLNDFISISLLSQSSELIKDIIQYLFVYTIGYGLISAVGFLFQKIKIKGKIFVMIAFLSVFIILNYFYKFENILNYKHPPLLFYSSYGIAISSVLYLLLNKIKFSESINSVLSWISNNCMNIYLAHIAVFYILQTLNINILGFKMFFVLLVCSLLIVLVLNNIKSIMCRRGNR